MGVDGEDICDLDVDGPVVASVKPESETEDKVAVVAGLDFGTLSVHVMLLDSSRGRLSTASASTPCTADARILTMPLNRTRITSRLRSDILPELRIRAGPARPRENP